MEHAMRHAATIATLVAGTAIGGVALGAEAERYRLEKSATGYVRMDTQSGEMSICEERAGQLVCRVAADERSAFQSDVERLEARVKSLEGRVERLENSLAARLESSLPSEEDFEKTMSYMERFFRGFLGIVREFEEERPGTDPGSPGGQRT
jgi:tetrahydromethanopterin S-methyltransferase subunit B